MSTDKNRNPYSELRDTGLTHGPSPILYWLIGSKDDYSYTALEDIPEWNVYRDMWFIPTYFGLKRKYSSLDFDGEEIWLEESQLEGNDKFLKTKIIKRDDTKDW